MLDRGGSARWLRVGLFFAVAGAAAYAGFRLRRTQGEALAAEAAPKQEREEFMVCRNVTKGAVVATRIDLAATRASRRQGLLGRTSLTADEGIHLVPCASVHTLGMKFAIDVVFLDDDSRVVEIRPSVPPGVALVSCAKAHSTLKLAAGAAALRKVQVGDRLVFATPAEEKKPAK